MVCQLCSKRITARQATNDHHPTLRSEGGTETITVHARCHRRWHSERGDFQRFGKRGGLETATRGHYFANLKRGARRLSPDEAHALSLRYAINPS